MANRKVLLDVPYYSQWLDVKDPAWRSRSCGVASLLMAMVFLERGRDSAHDRGINKLTLDELIIRGELSGAYRQNVGWIHEGLIGLAKECGFEGSFRKEWKADAFGEGILFILSMLGSDIPVITSVKSPAGGHLTLLTGFESISGEIAGFYSNDPDSRNRESGKNKYIKTADFLSLWKGRIIIVKK